MEIQFGYQRFSLCHDDFATQIALDIPLRSVFLHLRHKNLAEIIRDIQNITNFVDGDYDVVLAVYQRCTLKDYISYLLPT